VLPLHGRDHVDNGGRGAREGFGPFLAQAVLGAGAILASAALLEGGASSRHAAGWVFVAAAAAFVYGGAATMLDNAAGTHVLPLLRWGEWQPRPVQLAAGDPGVKAGQ
jgi:hypothetical protein